MSLVYLFLAVIAEVIGTSFLPATANFTKLLPTTIVAFSYLLSFWLLTYVLKTINLGITYAIWSGLGIVLVSLMGFLIYNQKLDNAAILGIGLIVAGVLILNLFSNSNIH